MKKLAYSITSLGLLALPMLVSAQSGQGFQSNGGEIGNLLKNLLIFTNNILIPFVIGIGFLFFVWGMFKFFIAGGADEDKRESGKQLMIYATLGFVLIIIFWGVVNLLAQSTGFEDEKLEDVPKIDYLLENR